MAKITNTGELRELLCSAINAVANGTMDADKARNITKIAGQVNESLYAEVKVKKLQMELKQASSDFGELSLTAK